MKKALSVLLCGLILLSFTVPALAAEDAPPGWLYPPDGPPGWLYPDGVPTGGETLEEENETGAAQAPEPEPEIPPSESVGAKDEIDTPGSSGVHGPAPVDTTPVDGYPVGSFIAPSGQVYFPSSANLSPDAPADEAVDAVSPSSLDVPDRADSGGQAALSVPGAAYVADLRPKDVPTEVLDGLKALVSSIFGEYTPITTTSVITQTVGNDTYQYLVETVAPGSAGVDYEWLASVFLFGILLFCLMKLLGGVLK